MKAIALVAFLMTGCAIGAGTSTVGIWRPKRVVDTDVCIQEKPDQCTRTMQVARDIPERSFGGGLFSWFNPGYMHISGAPQAPDRFALDSHYEYLRGRGGVALGLRVGGNIAFGSDALLAAFPVTLVGHWGYERFSLYGGPGYTPYANDHVKMGGVDTMTERRGVHVMAGGRVLIKAGRSIQLTTSMDVFRQYLDGEVATSVTAAFGIHL